MSFIAASVIAAAATIGGTYLATQGAKKVSNDATQTANNNNALARELYGENKAVLSPYVQGGNRAGTAMQSLLSLSEDPRAFDQAFQRYRDSTGYDFAFDEGNRAIQNSAAARGGLLSGNAIKAGQRYGQQAGQSMFQQYLDRLYGQQSQGLSAAGAQAGVSTGFGNQTTANNNAAMETRSNATLSSTGNINQLLASLSGQAGNLLGQQSFGSTYKTPGANAATNGWNPEWGGG